MTLWQREFFCRFNGFVNDSSALPHALMRHANVSHGMRYSSAQADSG
jgi:hypothetical protein